MQKAPLSIGIVLAFLPIAAASVAAPTCGEIYPGAKIGPPPEWNFWGYGSACYVRWVPKDDLDRERLLAQCQNTTGARFVHFEINSEIGDTLCLFKIPGTNPSALPEGEAHMVVPGSKPHNVTSAKASDGNHLTAKPTQSSREKTHKTRAPTKTRITAVKKKRVRVKPTASHTEQQLHSRKRVRSDKQIASSRTEIGVNGSPFLLKPVSSACFVSVHKCKP